MAGLLPHIRLAVEMQRLPLFIYSELLLSLLQIELSWLDWLILFAFSFCVIVVHASITYILLPSTPDERYVR